MSSNQFDDPRPSAVEEQAHKEARGHFSEHLNQYAASLTSVRELERSLAATAAEVLGKAALQTCGPENLVETADGTQWQRSAKLMQTVCLCHRPTGSGVEFAVIEHLVLQPGETNEVLARGRNAMEVLRTFVRDQKQALQIWTEDLSAQVREHLAEKYPGHDMNRVADGFIHRFTHPLPLNKTLAQTNGQKHGRDIRV